MKKKISRILGVGVTVALLASMMVIATPAAPAAADTLSWGMFYDFPAPFPPAVPAVEIADMAVNGSTIYAATGVLNPTGATTPCALIKSSNAGASWEDISQTTDFPLATVIELVAVAPDDPNVVIVATEDGEIYFSDDGGASWFDTKFPAGKTINDIDVSGMTGGYYYLTAGGVDGGNAELWARELSMKGIWEPQSAQGTKFAADQTQIKAVAFSPNFQIDRIIGVVSANATINAYFQCYHYEEDLYFWNSEIDGFDDWGTGLYLGDIKGTGAMVSASIAFASSYDGTDEGERIVFVGLTPETVSITTKYTDEEHGVYRLTDINATPITNWAGGELGPVYSVAYHEAGKLLIGDYNQNQVFACLDPMVREPSCERVHAYKQPGGTNRTMVAWSGDNAIAATQGNESAFAVSEDDGYTFNDISLVNTFPIVDDVAVSADGTVAYYSSHDYDGDVSIWLQVGPWAYHRVLSLKDQDDPSFKLRIAPDDTAVVFANPSGTRYIWVNQDSGKGKWNKRSCKVDPIQDFIAESSDVIHAVSTSGYSKSINGGASWSTEKGFEGKSAYMITLAPNNDILIGLNGYILYSKDGGNTLLNGGNADGFFYGDITLVADTNYADNGIIYTSSAASASPAPLVSRGKPAMGAFAMYMPIGLETPDEIGPPAGYRVKGMAMAGDALYVLASSDTESQLWRALNARDAPDMDYAKALWGYIGGSARGAPAQLPNALKIAPDYFDMRAGAAMPKLLAIGPAPPVFPAAVWGFGDPLATQGVTPIAPATEEIIGVNPNTGKAYNTTFNWERFHSTQIITCQMQIATDPNFDALVYDQEFPGITTHLIAEVIGPTGVITTTIIPEWVFKEQTQTIPAYTYITYDATGNVTGNTTIPAQVITIQVPFQITTTRTIGRLVDLMPGRTYYWRVRVSDVKSGPLLSPWTQTRSFTVSSEVPFDIVSPEVGATGVSILPSMSWTEYPGSIYYEVAIAEDPTFAILDVSHSADYTFYHVEEPLKYATTYYWRVRGVTGEAAAPMPTPASEWVTGVFTTMAEPVEPEPIVVTPPDVTVQAPPPADITVEAAEPAFPEYLLWTIVGIGAVLVIALIVLIVRTRRVV